MSILIDQNTRLIVQGITGRDGSFHTQQMKDYGTNVVAGVTPGKAGQSAVGVPVYNTVMDAKKATNANASVIYVPAAFAADAVMESVDAELDFVVCISEGIPANDMVKVHHYMKGKKTRLLGPNCPGLISPGRSKVGIIPAQITIPGPVGVVSRSGTLTYEIVYQLTNAGIGQSTCIGIGGDPIIGTNFIDALELFEKDPETKCVVMIGEIGGTDEQKAAAYVKANMKTPVIGFIAGKTAPAGKRMGHAGAIISGSSGTAAEKTRVLGDHGIPVATKPSDVVPLVKERLK